jgi:hypothetical protein
MNCKPASHGLKSLNLIPPFSSYINATTSPLLLLPAEIRNKIFAFATSHGTIKLDYEPYAGIERRQPEPLLFACRQTYSEVAPLPYKLNAFLIGSDYLMDLDEFLRHRTPEQVALMREVMWKMKHRKVDHVATAAKWIERLHKIRKLCGGKPESAS